MKLKFLVVPVVAAIMLAGCGDKETNSPVGNPATLDPAQQQTTATEPQTTEPATSAGPVLSKEGMVRSILTGEWVPEEIGNRRPFAIMINNIEDADPQSGIDRAEVVYEAYVESNITRLMMILQDYDDMDKIGPVRSCREFYVYFAKEFDAFYIHFGFSPLAATLLADSNVQALDGMKGWCSFYRTKDRVAPHNAYTTTEGILGSIDVKKWDKTLAEDFEGPLKFTQYDDVQVRFDEAYDCTKFKPGFQRNKPELIYNEEDGLYYRNQYGKPHCDMESGNQLAFKNIIVKFVDGTRYENGTPILELMGTGTGYYATNGKIIQITWEKDTQFGPTRYYYLDGTEVELNQGKTYIAVIMNDNFADVSFE